MARHSATVIHKCQQPETGDVLALGTLVATSAVLPSVCALYDSRKVHAPLYGYVVAPLRKPISLSEQTPRSRVAPL